MLEKFVNTVVLLEKECFLLPWSAVQIENELKKKDETVLLFISSSGDIYEQNLPDNIMPVGYCIASISISDRLCEIRRIGVQNDCRGRGFAEKILKHLENCMVNRSVPGLRMILEVAENNVSALRLYRRCGFLQISVRKNYYPDGAAALIFEKILE